MACIIQSLPPLPAAQRRGGRFGIAIALVALAVAPTGMPARAAGIPVVDAASIEKRALEHAAQIAKFVEQIAMMKNQLDQARSHFDAVTGSRNLGDLWKDPRIRAALPSDLQEILTLGNEANRISESIDRISKSETLTGSHEMDVAHVARRVRDLAVRSKAVLEQAQEGTTARLNQIDQLQSQINLAVDPKAISDLQARLLVEQANIQADQIRADLLNRQIEAEKELAGLQAREIAARSFSIDAIRAPLPGAQ